MVSFFLQHIKYEKRLSQHTILAYQTDLEQFVNYLKAQYDFEHLALADSPMVRSWVARRVQVGGCRIRHGILASQAIVTVKFSVEGTDLNKAKGVADQLELELRKIL